MSLVYLFHSLLEMLDAFTLYHIKNHFKNIIIEIKWKIEDIYS